MKPKLIEWIPIYGFTKYVKRYFDADKRGTNKEIQTMIWFQYYHLVIVYFLTGIAIKLFN